MAVGRPTPKGAGRTVNVPRDRVVGPLRSRLRPCHRVDGGRSWSLRSRRWHSSGAAPPRWRPAATTSRRRRSGPPTGPADMSSALPEGHHHDGHGQSDSTWTARLRWTAPRRRPVGLVRRRGPAGALVPPSSTTSRTRAGAPSRSCPAMAPPGRPRPRVSSAGFLDTGVKKALPSTGQHRQTLGTLSIKA